MELCVCGYPTITPVLTMFAVPVRLHRRLLGASLCGAKCCGASSITATLQWHNMQPQPLQSDRRLRASFRLHGTRAGGVPFQLPINGEHGLLLLQAMPSPNWVRVDNTAMIFCCEPFVMVGF
jgi:hypothetical protein